MRYTNLYLSTLFFAFLFISLSFSSYTVIYPGNIDQLFSSGSYLGIYSSNTLTLLDVSGFQKGNAMKVAEYKDKKVISPPFIFGESYIVPVEKGLVWLNPNFKEMFFMPFSSNVLYVEKSGKDYVVVTKKGIYLLKSNITSKTLGYVVNNSYQFKSEIYSAVVKTTYSYIAVLTDSYLYFFDKELNLLKVYEVSAHTSNLEAYKESVFFGDSYGNIYRCTPLEFSLIKNVGSSIYQVKHFSSYLVFATSKKGIYLYSPSTMKVYNLDNFYYDGLYSIDFSNLLIVGRKSIYTLNPTLNTVISEKRLDSDILSSAFINSGLILLTPFNELVYFNMDELKEGCYISKPRFFSKYGYMEEEIKGYATDKAELKVGNNSWIILTSTPGYFTYEVNPNKFEFGKIKIECKLLNKDDFHSITYVERVKDAVKGFFYLKAPRHMKQGEILNLTIKNQFGKKLNNFSVFLNKKQINATNPLVLELPPGKNVLVFKKEGYGDRVITIEVKEYLWFFYLKLFIVFSIIGFIFYFGFIKSGLLDRKVSEIMQKIKEKREE